MADGVIEAIFMHWTTMMTSRFVSMHQFPTVNIFLANIGNFHQMLGGPFTIEVLLLGQRT